MANITIAQSLDATVASTAHIIYTDAPTGTFKKCPISALPLTDAEIAALTGKSDTGHTHTLSNIGQSGATTGQVPVWGGSAWVPGDQTGAGGGELTEIELTDAATVVWDYSQGSIAVVEIAGNRTLSITNANAPCTGTLRVIQGAGAPWTLTLPGNVPNDYALSTAATEQDILGFFKYEDGQVFWDFRNYGTVTAPPTALNPPTSFAAGTPTEDGCPFTWTDTNSSPNESSYLIQITTAADTSYSSVVTTRTPAANATSAAAGTGLTASTAYRARIKCVGNGTTTSDSAYSSDVTFTTDAASGSNTFSGMPAMDWIAAFDADNGLTNMVTSGGIPDLVVLPVSGQTLPATDTNIIGGKNAWECTPANAFELDFTSATIGDYYLVAMVLMVDAYSFGGTDFNVVLSTPGPAYSEVISVDPDDGVKQFMQVSSWAGFDGALPTATPTLIVGCGMFSGGNFIYRFSRDGSSIHTDPTLAAQLIWPNTLMALGNYYGTGSGTNNGDVHIGAFYLGTSDTPYTAADAIAVEDHLKAYYSIS